MTSKDVDSKQSRLYAVQRDDVLVGQECSDARDGAWWVYLLECADGSLYAGITTDLVRRLKQHNGHRTGGARCTRARRPVRLVYAERQPGRGAASRREAAIKRMRLGDKRALAQTWAGRG